MKQPASNTGLTVCMFSNLFPPIVSGSATQLAALSRELVARGCKVVVITAKTRNATADRENIDGVHVYRLPAIGLPRMEISLNFPWLSWTFFRGNLKRIEAILAEHQPDVLHLHNHMFDLAFSAVVMRRRFRVPLVVTIHTMIKHARQIFNWILYPLDRVFLKRTVIRHCDAIVSPDVNIRAYVESAWSVHDSEIVPYGITLTQTPTPELIAELRARYDLADKAVVLSLGHVYEIRNRRDLVEAFALVLEKVPNAVLLIVGTEATAIPRDLAKAKGIEASVRFAGYLPHAEVQALLAMCEIEAHWLTQDDPKNTSLGIASLEAMAAGKPIFAAANPDTYGAGVLRDGHNMIVVQPGDPERLAKSMVELLLDESKRVEIGRRAQRTVRENFLWDSVCSRTTDIYAKLIDRRRTLTSSAEPVAAYPAVPRRATALR